MAAGMFVDESAQAVNADILGALPQPHSDRVLDKSVILDPGFLHTARKEIEPFKWVERSRCFQLSEGIDVGWNTTAANLPLDAS